MASLYKRGEWFWIAYYANGEHVQRALGTDDERIAKQKKKQIEYELSIGELQAASRLPIGTVLQQFCEHLRATRTFKSCKNDVSRLRVFFGPICEALELGVAGGWSKTKTSERATEQAAHAHRRLDPRVERRQAPGDSADSGAGNNAAGSDVRHIPPARPQQIGAVLHRLDRLAVLAAQQNERQKEHNCGCDDRRELWHRGNHVTPDQGLPRTR